ncbi:MAG: radical SAM protein [Candidatus Woesearchaeota archaeon]
MIEIGSDCNQHCTFCCQADQRGLPDKGTEQIKREIDRAAADGVNNLSIQGGEFTIRPDCIELVEFAFQKNCFKNIHVTTNGLVFAYKAFSQRIAQAGLSAANFSIHSPRAKVHDALTRRSGSFELSINGIRNLSQCYNPTSQGRVNICSSITVVKHNFHDLIKLIDLLADLGIHDFHLNYAIPTGNALKNFDSVVPRFSEISGFVHKAISHCVEKEYKIFVTGIPLCFMTGFEVYLDEAHKSEFTMVPFHHPGKDIITNYKAEVRMSMKVKHDKCKNCGYDRICEGVFKNYVDVHGFEEMNPSKRKFESLFDWHIG